MTDDAPSAAVASVDRPPPSWRVRINMVVGRVLFGVLYRVSRSSGAAACRGTGPVVFVANHAGFLDGPMLPALAPRPTSVLVKREMFKGLLGSVPRPGSATSRSPATPVTARR